MKTIKDYLQGERFVYGKKNCLVLEHMNDGTLCMVLDEDYTSEFGKSNNFAESTLREKLNTEYLNKWIDDGAFRADFVKMTVDLTTNDGLKDYDACECFLAPRTCDQHRKYRYLIPSPKIDWEWEATAYSTKENGYVSSVRGVASTGDIDSSFYGINYLYRVRPLFKLNPDAIIVPDTITVTIPLKEAEPQMPSKAEPCKHEFENLYYYADSESSVKDDYCAKANSVWAWNNKEYKRGRLVCCKKCGQVFVKEFEEEGK